MRFKLILIALASLCLPSCTTLSAPPAKVKIPASLTAPCPQHQQRTLETWGDLALDYVDLLAEFGECRAQQAALVKAVTAP